MDHTRQFLRIGEPVLIDWSTQGDEWLARFGQVLDGHDSGIRMTGYGYGQTASPCIEIRTAHLDTPSTEYKLSLMPQDEVILLLIDLDKIEEIPVNVVDVWLDAARVVAESLGKKYHKHHWSAIIGPTPSRMSVARIGVDSEGLATPGYFGGLEFSSSGTHVLERFQSPEMPSFSGFYTSGSVPIMVRGSSRGYSWDNASTTAARDLNRACAMLSVAWGVCMVIRESHAPLEWGIRSVPDRSVDSTQQLPTNPVVDREIPSWTESAWKIVKEKTRLANAIAAFHEGFKVETTNPSLALVAFISSIEAVSQMIFREDRCTECRTHRHIGAKFRKTLRLVLPSEKSEELGKLYSVRSNTVHLGRLHGFESIAGSLWPGMWSQDNQREFTRTSVYPMREATREILALALKDNLPHKQAYIPEG